MSSETAAERVAWWLKFHRDEQPDEIARYWYGSDTPGDDHAALLASDLRSLFAEHAAMRTAITAALDLHARTIEIAMECEAVGCTRGCSDFHEVDGCAECGTPDPSGEFDTIHLVSPCPTARLLAAALPGEAT